MSGKKGKIIRINNFKQRINILHEVFGQEILHSGVNIKTLEKWYAEKIHPRETTLQAFLEPMRLTTYEFSAPKNKFAEKIAECSQELYKNGEVKNAYQLKDILDLIEYHEQNIVENAFCSESNETNIPKEANAGSDLNTNSFFYRTIESISANRIEYDYQILKGKYILYYFWQHINQEQYKIAIRPFEIYDRNKQVMLCQSMLYEGWILMLKNKLFAFLESSKEGRFYPEIFSIMIKYPYYWPEEQYFFLYGIISMMTIKGDPASTNVLIRKVNTNESWVNRYYFLDSEQELLSMEKYGEDILDWISQKKDSQSPLIASRPNFLDYAGFLS